MIQSADVMNEIILLWRSKGLVSQESLSADNSGTSYLRWQIILMLV